MIRSVPNTGLFNCGHDFVLWKLLWHHIAVFLPETPWWGQLSDTSFWWGGLRKTNKYVKCAEVRKTLFKCKKKKRIFLKHTCAMNIFKTRPLTESEHREKAFVSKSKINISHWVKCSGLGWPKRKFVNSAYINAFPPTRLWLSCSAWTHCEGSNDAFRAGTGTTMVSLTQAAFNSIGKSCWMSRKLLQMLMLVSP